MVLREISIDLKYLQHSVGLISWMRAALSKIAKALGSSNARRLAIFLRKMFVDECHPSIVTKKVFYYSRAVQGLSEIGRFSLDFA